MCSFASCAQREIEEFTSNKVQPQKMLTVGFAEDETRIELDEYCKTVWTNGDEVSVFYLNDGNSKWVYEGNTGARSASLTPKEENTGSVSFDNIVIAYPYNTNHTIDESGTYLSVEFADTQNYLADSYGLGANIMVASSETSHFTLKSVCGWLKLMLTGDGQAIKEIIFRGNNNEPVAGTFLVSATDASIEITSNTRNTQHSITLDCGDNGIVLGPQATAFYIAIPPQQFTNGASVEIIACDGSSKCIGTTALFTIERNYIQPINGGQYDAVPAAMCELAYSTNDGHPVELYTTEGFGANLVENIYDSESGMGILRFDNAITAIPAYALYNNSNISEVVIPDAVKSIGQSAFEGCSSLNNAIIGSSTKSIGKYAFENCSKLSSLTMGDSVTTIGDAAFKGCSSLERVYTSDINKWLNIRFNDEWDKANPLRNGADLYVDGKRFTYWNVDSSIDKIGNHLRGCTSLEKVTMHNNITTIEGYAFSGCTNLQEIEIGKGVTSIAAYAFENCSSLAEVDIPDSVNSIGAYAFKNCSSLKVVSIGNGLSTMGGYTFSECNNLESLYINDIEKWCLINFSNQYDNPLYYCQEFYINNQLASHISIPESITKIRKHTFTQCKSLSTIAIPQSVTEIEAYAFQKSSIAELTIPDSVTKIGSYAFNSCDKLKRVVIGDGVTEIGGLAFRYCTSMVELVVGNSVSSVEGSIFADCTSLKNLTLKDGISTLGNAMFSECDSLEEVTIPDSVTSVGQNLFSNCDALKEVSIGSGITSIVSSMFIYCTSLTDVTIPHGITTVHTTAFFGCSSLEEITFPDSLTKIDYHAFGSCKKLARIDLGDGLQTLGDSVFHNCSSLEDITLPASITKIGNFTFQDCSNLTNFYCKATTPPTVGTYLFTGSTSKLTIYVPAESEQRYMTDTTWKSYTQYIDGYNF